MSRYKLEVNGWEFSSKTKLKEYCRSVLGSQPSGLPLEGKALDVVGSMFKRHTEYRQKTRGLDYFISVRQCDVNFKNNQFYIERSDGGEVAFSYTYLINMPSPDAAIKTLLRNAIREQTIVYKTEYFKENQDRSGFVICPVTELKIKRCSSHLDHYPVQFDEIVLGYHLTEEQRQILLITEDVDAPEKVKILDDFREHHLKVATYRVVLDKVNQQRPKYKAPSK